MATFCTTFLSKGNSSCNIKKCRKRKSWTDRLIICSAFLYCDFVQHMCRHWWSCFLNLHLFVLLAACCKMLNLEWPLIDVECTNWIKASALCCIISVCVYKPNQKNWKRLGCLHLKSRPPMGFLLFSSSSSFAIIVVRVASRRLLLFGTFI